MTTTTGTTATNKLNKIMEQVRQMLAVANHPNTGAEEADAFRTRAETLMLKYRIEESQLSTEERALSGIRPMKRSWRVAPYSSEFTQEQYSLAYWALHHVDGRISQRIEYVDGVSWLVVDVYGFESDLLYAEAIFTASQVTFASRLEPSVDRKLSDAENCYNMRGAGMERNRIANALWGSAMNDGSAHGKVQRLYKAECERRGEDPTVAGKGTNAKTYRSSYAQSFVNGIYSRLWRLREARAQDSTGELVLQSRKDDVDELFYQDHPYMRPATPEQRAENAARAAKEDAKKPRKARARKYQTRPVNYVAAAKGRDAANRVDLSGGNAPKERRMDRDDTKQIGE